MKVTCPDCGYVGNLAEKMIPDNGRNLKCPKCKKEFFVRKQTESSLGTESPEKVAEAPVVTFDPLDTRTEQVIERPLLETQDKRISGTLETINKNILGGTSLTEMFQKKLLIILTIIIVIQSLNFFLFGALLVKFRNDFLHPKYEYIVKFSLDSSFDATMRSMGEQGWELVTARRATTSGDSVGYECIFIRRK